MERRPEGTRARDQKNNKSGQVRRHRRSRWLGSLKAATGAIASLAALLEAIRHLLH